MDWCAIRGLPLTPLRHEFEEILDEVRAHPKEYGFHGGEHYAVQGSLEPFGMPINFYGWKKHKDPVRGQTHKFEFQKTGELKMGDIYKDMERIVAINPDELEIMRTDLCADLSDVTVEDVNRRMRVQYKRRGSRVTEYLHIWKGAGETFYHGARPNCFRVYNKTAQLEDKFNKEMRSLKKNATQDVVMKTERFDKEAAVLAEAGYLSAQLEPDRAKKITIQFRDKLSKLKREAAPVFTYSPFEDVYKLKKDSVLTRVERQMGTRVPNALSTLGKLKKNLIDFDPFSPIDILQHSSKLPSRNGFTFAQYECGLSLRKMMEEFGRDYTQNYIKIHNSGNTSRAVELYTPFLEAVACERFISREQMTECYRDSVSRQIAA
jgi:hypothetical protein